MVKKEVERWEPASMEMAKNPIPLWGATSIKVKGSEAVGPIFNVKRENDFAANELISDPLTTKKPEMGDKMIPYPCYPIKGQHGFTGVGTPQTPCDVGGMPKTQYGPTYGFSDGKNGYVPHQIPGAKKEHRPCPLINAPVFSGVETGSGKFAPMPTPKVSSELLMSGPVFPIPDHYSKYTTQNFGCSGSGLKVERPKELCGPGNRDIGDRNSAVIDPMGPKGMYIPEVKEVPHPAVLMTGPKMPGIQADNLYNVVPNRVPTASARMEMPGPVYPGVSCENHYSEVHEVVHGELFHPLPLHGPNVESKNCYNPQAEKQPGQLVMSGPKFRGVDDHCKYAPAIKKADTESLIVMAGPCFRQTVHTSLYNESPTFFKGDRLMTTPIFPGIEAKNVYGPVEPDLAPKEKQKYEKPFVAPNYPGIQASNKYGCSKDEIENGMPQPFRQTEGQIMQGPKYPGITEFHEYNPPSKRDELPTIDIVSVPVYIEDGSNHYCNIPEKQYGELFHPLPLHGPNVESKNCYNPQMEKQPGQLVMAGPKFVGVDDQCKYTPAIKKADTEGLIVMAGPCFRQTVHTSLYNETPARAPIEGTPLMTSPIYPGIKAENNFGPAHMGF